ncbi:MAG: double-strand break repair helicase AddA [Hyphomicrobiales bacterium]
MNEHARPSGPDRNDAADPSASAFVEANAGSGKTSVLVSRVTRLLLAGAPLEKIVCLTFTRAAAAEMAGRLFRTLGGWLALDDDGLAAQIRKDCGEDVARGRLVAARRLFARAIETPGGLKVQTIHGFCESVLQRFPVEAGVVPGFRVLEEDDARALLERAIERVLDAVSNARAGDLAAHFRTIAPHMLQDKLVDIVRLLMIEEEALARALAAEAQGRLAEALAADLGITAETAPEWSIDEAAWRQMLTALQDRPSTTNDGRAHAVAHLLATSDSSARRRLLNEVLFKGDGDPRTVKKIIAAGKKPVPQHLLSFLEEEQMRVAALEDCARACDVRDLSRALVIIGSAVIDTYRAEKQRRGVFDFADLIAATKRLLDGGRAPFVLYKLDGGIDHILVDEAQDTSPDQWDIASGLSEEFFAGAGARDDASRTVFAVGDPKQSIFSFQGAAPERFGAMRSLFERRVTGAGGAFHSVPLHVSFRTGPTILRCIDAIFADPQRARQVTGRPEPTVHEASDKALPGIFELWPPIPRLDAAKRSRWTPPPPGGAVTPAERREARRIAAAVARWIATGEEAAPGGPPITPASVLVLVRRRTQLMDELVRALRAAGIPVAGADRLKLAEHIAVQDLLAAARFALLPDDELSLAEVLKGPFIGLDDEALMALCFGRGRQTLWEAVQSADAHAEARVALESLVDAAASSGPFTFFSRLLSGDHRRRILERLGPEAAEPIDELLALALDHETGEGATLAGFMGWIAAAEPEIKRDMEAGSNEVRVMTVHGAKGLEADVVIVADTCSTPDDRFLPSVLVGASGYPLWRPSKRFGCRAVEALRDRAKAAAAEEYQRLLYVALTRARYRVVVAGHEVKDGKRDACWHAAVLQALDPLLPPPDAAYPVEGARRIVEVGAVKPDDRPKPPAIASIVAPGWLARAAQPETRRRLSPSAFLKPAPGRPAVAAGGGTRERGVLVHRLLEVLPSLAEEAREARAQHWLERRGLSAGEAAMLAAEVMAILNDAAFAHLFGPASLAEVPVVGRVTISGVEHEVSGRIDRLAFDGDTLWLADFKSDRAPPPAGGPAPASYAAQLALYGKLLYRLYPARRIRAALVWTALPRLDEVPESLLSAAYASAEAAFDPTS